MMLKCYTRDKRVPSRARFIKEALPAEILLNDNDYGAVNRLRRMSQLFSIAELSGVDVSERREESATQIKSLKRHYPMMLIYDE